ncbi:hypothetical protein SGFS_018020 [Streptomyces graminofaciens]|uniref:Uncharacterized protein n=1 Tax=Streptomyces graminofaciens TaxID=68212 RepID=A0ABN5VE38_9ACTN|nr:hypothetical protein SGFS_018020 [Streptomyces graminofaciens]
MRTLIGGAAPPAPHRPGRVPGDGVYDARTPRIGEPVGNHGDCRGPFRGPAATATMTRGMRVLAGCQGSRIRLLAGVLSHAGVLAGA